MAGHGRSGFTWSGVSGETPPQSSMPASMSAREVVAEVRRRLQVHRRSEHDARDGDRPEHLVGIARCCAVHRRSRLREEVLDDDFLDVPVPRVARRDGAQRVDPLRARLADAHEDPGREGHARTAGCVECRETAFGCLVGRAVVGPAGLAETSGKGLEHHPLRRADRSEALERRRETSAPAFAWGRSPVSSSTAPAAATR